MLPPVDASPGVGTPLLAAWRDASLFLDFDGTLVELAERPEQVQLAPAVLATLASLQQLLGGRLALVSGRPIAQLDAMLSPLLLPLAGVHGLERRGFDGVLHRIAPPDLTAVRTAAHALAALHPGLWVEEKFGALALHYRQAPALGPLCDAAMAEAVRQSPGTVLLQGKMVAEIKPAGIDKGSAVCAFLAEVPFAGHAAVFAGDDVTDEAGFAMVQALGGIGIKVGPGPTVAQLRIASPAALHDLLQQLLDVLSRRVQ